MAKLKSKNILDSSNRGILHFVIGSLPYPVYVYNIKTSKLILANSAARDIHKGHKCYSNLEDQSCPCDLKINHSTVEEVKRLKKPIRKEQIYLDENNNQKTFEYHGYPIFDANGEMSHIFEYSLDITERKQLDEKYKDIYEELKKQHDELILQHREIEQQKKLLIEENQIIEDQKYTLIENNIKIIEQKEIIEAHESELRVLLSEITEKNDEITAQRDEIEKHRDLLIQEKDKIEEQTFELLEKNIKIIELNEEVNAQKDEIEAQRDFVTKQKEQIEEINKELTGSIAYAQRIQSVMLSIPETISCHLKDMFILFRPKSIVSGDFYWASKVENHLLIAIADCTGHGVPGAFMSMLGITFLNDIINVNKIIQPDLILNMLRARVIEALHQKGTSGEQKDGMDITLCSINLDTYRLQFSGANNPVYLVTQEVISPAHNIRVHNFEHHTIYELKPDKMPVAIYIKMDPFSRIDIDLHKGDKLYLFSDGYADQFGGGQGKKFKYPSMMKAISEISHKPMIQQKKELLDIFENWMHPDPDHFFDQIDDVTILGMEV